MEPVKKSDAPDYYEIIRFPIGARATLWKLPNILDGFSFLFTWIFIISMFLVPADLKTMTERLKNRYYVTKKLFIADLQRIISNCREYNPPDSEYCKSANTLEKFFYFKLKDGGLIEK